MKSPGTDTSDADVRRHYVGVIVVWVLTLAALYAFQQYFS
jgi:hypothetical protein